MTLHLDITRKNNKFGRVTSSLREHPTPTNLTHVLCVLLIRFCLYPSLWPEVLSVAKCRYLLQFRVPFTNKENPLPSGPFFMQIVQWTRLTTFLIVTSFTITLYFFTYATLSHTHDYQFPPEIIQ